MSAHPPAWIKQVTITGSLIALLAAGCATRIPSNGEYTFKVRTLRGWYLAEPGAIKRKAVSYEHVEFLWKKPTDRKFHLIGHVLPTNWKLMGSEAAAVAAVRASASLYGADAVYFVDKQEIPTAPKHTAAAIVWE